MEYGLRWVRESWVCVGHVHFMLFVLILFALVSQRKHVFFVEYGLTISDDGEELRSSDGQTAGS